MAEIKTINYIPLADTTARENITTINENITTINENISQLSDSIGNLSGGTYSSIEPSELDIPRVFFDEAIPQTKDDVVTKFRYISKTQDISGYAEFKAQGNSSMNYPKKNVTVKMYQDEALETKLKVNFKDWGKQSKHVYKANWIDLTHSRNIVSARLWSQVVKSRSDYANYPNEFKTSPNQGAIDGFPIKVYSQGVYQGRYTLNIPKDKWMANMDDSLDNHCILCGENYESGCFRAVAKIDESDWTDEIHDTVPTSIKTRWNEIISFVTDSSDSDFKANLKNYFYVDSLIDYFIFGMVSCGLDAFGKNQLYDTYDGQKWIACMYDMDSTWGLLYNGAMFVSSSYSRTQYEDFVNDRQGNLLYIRLVQLFVNKIKARYEELKNGVLSVPNIINEFERFTDITSLDLVKEDYASTTGSGKFTGIPLQSANNIQQIRKYIIDRYTYCDEYFNSLVGDDSGSEEGGDEPSTEATLTSIEATYSGGDVTVGTELTDLTSNLVVTTNYDDGTSKTVLGYELSGVINEGSNTITVTYQGMTTTFTVNGYYELEVANSFEESTWTVGYFDDNGEVKEVMTMHHSQLIPITNENILITSHYTALRISYFDKYRNYITFDRGGGLGVHPSQDNNRILLRTDVTNAMYYAISVNTNEKANVFVLNREELESNRVEVGALTNSKSINWITGAIIGGSGAISDYISVNEGEKYTLEYFGLDVKKCRIAFYDENKVYNFDGDSSANNHGTHIIVDEKLPKTFTIPNGDSYMMIVVDPATNTNIDDVYLVKES